MSVTIDPKTNISHPSGPNTSSQIPRVAAISAFMSTFTTRSMSEEGRRMLLRRRGRSRCCASSAYDRAGSSIWWGR